MTDQVDHSELAEDALEGEAHAGAGPDIIRVSRKHLRRVLARILSTRLVNEIVAELERGEGREHGEISEASRELARQDFAKAKERQSQPKRARQKK